jgi:hypothetical protein
MPDCIDTYWGPEEWRESILTNPPSLNTLRSQAVEVATEIQQSSFPKNRKQRLQFQTRALLWLIRAHLGEKIMFSEQVRLLLDVQPESVDNSLFIQAHEMLADVLPQDTSLIESWTNWQAAYTRPIEAVLPQLRQVFSYLSNYWPQAAETELELIPKIQSVRCQPYSIYIPANMPVRVDRLLHLAASWAAMCAVITANAGRCEDGETESAVWLNYGPQQLLAQGLSHSFLLAARPYEAITPSILQASEVPTIPASDLHNIHMAEDALRWVDANAALMLHGEGIRPRVLRRYIAQHKLVGQEAGEALLDHLANPFKAAHIFAPLIGGPLIKAWLDKNNMTFDSLLKDPPVPSTMLFEVRFGD